MSSKRFVLVEDPKNAPPNDDEMKEIEGNTSEEEEDQSEEEDESEEEEDDEEDESEEEDDSSKNPTVKKPETKKKQVSDSKHGSVEETGSASVTERKDQVKNPKPSVVKNQGSKEVKPDSTKSTTKKRSSEIDASTTDAKRVKRVSGETEKENDGGREETKRNYFQRVFTDEDEIALLQGVIDYKNKTGASPSDDRKAFYEFVKKSISVDVTKIQLMEKLRNLKNKFEKNIGKGKKNGEDLKLSTPHDRKAFDLSKFVWGANGIMALESSAVKSNAKSNKIMKVEPVEQEAFVLPSLNVESVLQEQEFVSIVNSVAHFGVDRLTAQQGWNMLASEDKKIIEEQWKELQLWEFKFFSKKSGFIHEVVTKMAEAFRQNP